MAKPSLEYYFSNDLKEYLDIFEIEMFKTDCTIHFNKTTNADVDFNVIRQFLFDLVKCKLLFRYHESYIYISTPKNRP